MACLDTSFLIDLSHAKLSARKKLEDLLSNGERVVTTAVKRISRSLRSREIRQYPGLKAGASFQDGSQAGALRRKGSERRPSYAARRLLPGLKPGASAGGTLGNLRAAQIPVNAAELYEGAWRSSRALAQVGELDRMLQGVVILEMTLVAAREFGRLKTDLQRQGTSVGDWDLLIASIALACGESRVVTRNAKDFERIPGIEVVSC